MSLAKLQPTSHPILIPSHLLTEKLTWSQKSEKLLPPPQLLMLLLLLLTMADPILEELGTYLSSVSNFKCLAGMQSFTSHTNTRN